MRSHRCADAVRPRSEALHFGFESFNGPDPAALGFAARPIQFCDDTAKVMDRLSHDLEQRVCEFTFVVAGVQIERAIRVFGHSFSLLSVSRGGYCGLRSARAGASTRIESTFLR